MRTKAGRVAGWTLVLVASLLATPNEAAEKKKGQPFHWTGSLAPGKTLTIEAINGSIRAEASSGAQVVVDAEKWGRRNDPDKVEIEVEEGADGIAVYVRDSRSRRSGHFGCSAFRSDVVVDFKVRVPAGVRAVFTTINGGIEADLRGPIRARTVNGPVAISTTDRADAKTVNGPIMARMRPGGASSMEFGSVNGSIRVELPSNSSADVKARTINGSIRSDFPMTIRSRWIGRRLEGRIGDGGPQVKMGTVNGNITLHSI